MNSKIRMLLRQQRPIIALISVMGLSLFNGCFDGDANRNPRGGEGVVASVPATGHTSTGEDSTAQRIALEDWDSSIHSLEHDSIDGVRKISAAQKTVTSGSATYTDRIFTDALNREAVFRGFNVSGSVKHVEKGFKPFKNTADATASFDQLGKRTGSNVVRFTIAWEGTHPAEDTIDYAYLDAVVAQMKAAIANDMYILLDYHEDLFSRHLFNEDSWYTGNGAPAWVTPASEYPEEYCGIVCAVWGQNLQTNEAIRLAFRNFWNNAPFPSNSGIRYLQDEFIWQVGQTANYIKNSLSADEFSYILGLDPFNEPADGGTEGLDYDEWDNQKLWPFYENVRTALDANGWNDKPVYAEPLVFWNSTVGWPVEATGGHHLNYQPGPGFVFNAHFYDAARMGGVNGDNVDNGSYYPNIDQIRDEARYLGIAPFVSEFGMALDGTGSQDPVRILNGSYQAFDQSDAGKSKDRFAALYQPVISSTQWQWDYYYDHHNEFHNGNSGELRTGEDAWNDENFSVIRDYAGAYNLPQNLLERGYIRYSQGRILGAYYNAMTGGMDWGSIRITSDKMIMKPYFKGKKFLFVSWMGRHSDAPTELYIPRHFNENDLLVVTDQKVHNGDLIKDGGFTQAANEVALTSDPGKLSGAGHRLLVWDDAEAGENENTIHFALVVEDDAGLSSEELATLQAGLAAQLSELRQSPVYMSGSMGHSGYPSEAENTYFEMKYAGRCMDVSNASTSNGANIQLWDCNGSNAQKWAYDPASGYLTTKLNSNKCVYLDGNAVNGTNIHLRTCGSSSRYRWYWNGSSLRNQGDLSKAVDSAGSHRGANVLLWHYWGGDNQNWLRYYAAPRYFELKYAGRCMDVDGSNTGNGTQVRLWDCNGSNAQKWFYDQSSGFLRSRLNWNKCLNVSSASNGSTTRLWDCNNNDNTKFDWDVSSAVPSLRSRLNYNKAVDSAGSHKGATILMWDYWGGVNQHWTVSY